MTSDLEQATNAPRSITEPIFTQTATNLERVTYTADIVRILCEASKHGLHVPMNTLQAEWAGKLLAFEQAVLAKRDEDINRERDGRLEFVALYDNLLVVNESLQAKLAMQAENITRLLDCEYKSAEEYEATCDAMKSLNATQANVDAFMQGKKAEWEKSVLLEAANTIEIYECNDEMKRKLRAMAEKRGGVR